ncbi:MAG: carboxymuconolactone decarboxylase family protein [Pseudooceanicola sp.]|nr:carboxymuconolactone decarboxylase family protein [Pseudooceanicola sp.]
MPQTPFPPLSDADWPEAARALRDGFAGGLNVYRVMAHHPALLNAWAPLRAHVVVDNVLGKQFSEVVILRTGVNLASSYEWNQHIVRARACGMSDARIASIRGATADMAADDATLATAVDDLFTTKRLTPPTRNALAALVGSQGVFDVIATVGFYSTLGYILNSFDTPLDDDIAMQLAANPHAP